MPTGEVTQRHPSIMAGQTVQSAGNPTSGSANMSEIIAETHLLSAVVVGCLSAK